MKKMIVLICCLLSLGVISRADAIPVQWSVNGHYYEAIYVPLTILWAEANDIAASKTFMGLQGHLATITSAEENQFLVNTFPGTYYYALGGFQPSGSPEPAGGWEWITGEPFIYTNWNLIEPNNVGGYENALAFANNDWPPFGSWNDVGAVDNSLKGYFVEYSDPVPEPATMLLLGSGLIGLSGFRRKSKRS